jgi:hypothetical protein
MIGRLSDERRPVNRTSDFHQPHGGIAGPYSGRESEAQPADFPEVRGGKATEAFNRLGFIPTWQLGPVMVGDFQLRGGAICTERGAGENDAKSRYWDSKHGLNTYQLRMQLHGVGRVTREDNTSIGRTWLSCTTKAQEPDECGSIPASVLDMKSQHDQLTPTTKMAHSSGAACSI